MNGFRSTPTIVAEFSIPAGEFVLGPVRSSGPDVELQCVVPATDAHVLYIWIAGGDPDDFVAAVRDEPAVVDATLLDTIRERRLYRIELETDADELVASIVESNATMLEATGADDAWSFRLWFSDHDHLARFYNACLARGLTEIALDRVYSLGDRSDRPMAFELTPEQREAVVLAAQRGYFSTPRAASLDELAAEIGISQQALSQRIRRANKKIVLEALSVIRTDAE